MKRKLFTLLLFVLAIGSAENVIAQNCKLDTFTQWSGLLNNYTSGIAGNSKGVVVARHFNGLSVYDGTNWSKYVNAGLEGQGMAVDDSGNVWLGSFYMGLIKVNKTTGTTFYDTSDGLSGMQLSSIAAGPDGKIYIAVNGFGLSVFDGTNFTTLDTNDGLCDMYIHSMVFDKNGQLYTGSYNGCISKFNGTTFSSLPEIKTGGEYEIARMDFDPDGNLVVATYNFTGSPQAEIFKFDSKTGKWQNINFPMPGQVNIMGMKIDKNGYYWLATNMGAAKFDGKDWHFGTAGMVSMLGGVVIDNKNNIWFSSDMGVGRLTETTEIKGNAMLFNAYALLYRLDNSGIKGIVKVDSVSCSQNYDFMNVVPGRYIVFIKPDKTTSPDYIGTYSGDKDIWQVATVINAAFCDSTYLMNISPIKLPAPTPTAKGHITGFIKSTDGTRAGTQPIKDVDVTLKKVPGGVIKQVKTDLNGFFEFFQVDTGYYAILVDMPGLNQDTTRIVEITPTDTNHQNQDYEVDSNGIHVGDFTGIADYKPSRNILVYPNPSSEKVFIDLILSEPQKVIIEIYSLQGDVLYSKQIEKAGIISETIDFMRFSQGIYLLKVQTGQSINQYKLIRN